MKTLHALSFATALAFAAIGCEKSSAAEHRRTADGAAGAVERNDELAITTRDGNVVLALTKANTVVMRLSDSLRQHVNGEVAEDFARDSADSRFGRWLQRQTAGLVSKGMAIELAVPVSEIEDVRYEDGEIRFDYRKHRKLKFHAFKKDGHSTLSDFAPEDAERFVEQLRAKIGKKA